MKSKYRLDPQADNYCVMGNPVAHSKSPRIHQAFARQCGQNLYYQAIEVERDGFGEALDAFREQGGKGLNITVPFKADAWRSVQVLTDRARCAGSVNTIRIAADGVCYGDTTDGAGLVRDLRNHQVDLHGRKLLLLGAGGAVHGVIKSLHDQGPARILVLNRTAARARQLVRKFRTLAGVQAVSAERLAEHRFDLIINGTAASLYGELPPLADAILAPDAVCYDMVYGDEDTVFVRWAHAQGAAMALDGLGMLVEQAAESFYFWRGVRPDTGPVIEMLRAEPG